MSAPKQHGLASHTGRFSNVSPNSPAVFLRLQQQDETSRGSLPASPSLARSLPRSPLAGSLGAAAGLLSQQQSMQLQHSSPASSVPSSPIRTKHGCHSPYAFSVLPNSTAAAAAATSAASSTHTLASRPSGAPMSPTMLPAAVPSPGSASPVLHSSPPPTYNVVPPSATQCAHQQLRGKCSYITLPTGMALTHIEDAEALSDAASAAHQQQQQHVHSSSSPTLNLLPHLFFGQVRFETTAEELQWLIQTLAQVTALKIESRGKGCFAAVFRDEIDAQKVRELHKKVLFDYNGVWIAKTREEKELLAIAAREHSQMHASRARLPKDCMVVEDQKSNRGGGGMGSHQPHHMQSYTSPHHTPHTPPFQFAAAASGSGFAASGGRWAQQSVLSPPGAPTAAPYTSPAIGATAGSNSEYGSAASSWTSMPPFTGGQGGMPPSHTGAPVVPLLYHSSGPSSPTAALAPQMPLPPPPSYMEAIRSGSTSTAIANAQTPSVSVEHSPVVRPRQSDSVVMSPVVAEAPKYSSLAPMSSNGSNNMSPTHAHA